MKSLLLAILMLGVGAVHSAETGLVARTCAELTRAHLGQSDATRFDIEATVTFVRSPRGRFFAVKDATGETTLRDYTTSEGCPYHPGEVLRLRGSIQKSKPLSTYYGAHEGKSTSVTRIADGPVPSPFDAHADDLLMSRQRHRFVTITATARDAIASSSNAKGDRYWATICLYAESELIFAHMMSNHDLTDYVNRLIGNRCRLKGVVVPLNIPGFLPVRGIMISEDEPVELLSPANEDPFDVPKLDENELSALDNIAALGLCKVRGTVLAICRERFIVMRTGSGHICRIETGNMKLPAAGERIEAVGIPVDNVIEIIMARGLWRKIGESQVPPDPATDITMADFFNRTSSTVMDIRRSHGRKIRTIGTVVGIPSRGASLATVDLASDGRICQLDASGCRDAVMGLELGSKVEATGIVVFTIDQSLDSAVIPRVRQFSIALQNRDGIRVIARPPWWNTGRLMAAIALLAILIVAILCWNAALRRLAERRARKLAEEEISRAESELKVYERARLAVELHDSIAQNLSGVSLEIDSALQLENDDDAKRHQLLTIASRALQSCRADLRNCIWDLRNEALDLPDMNEAIRQTTGQHLDGVDLRIRFNIPRERLSDPTAHAILRIIRELSVNAVRHGGATVIRIAGGIVGNQLLFSVRDNGCGFDPEHAPGIAEGHFGLQGIRERIKRFNGTFRLKSAVGRGTKAVVTITIQKT